MLRDFPPHFKCVYYNYYYDHFVALCTLYGTTRVSQYQKVHFATFWIFWCKMITQADAPTIRLVCHPIQTNWCPDLYHPHNFYAGCPTWHNPLNLCWLGTGTKYALLHTQWLGSLCHHKSYSDHCCSDFKTLWSSELRFWLQSAIYQVRQIPNSHAKKLLKLAEFAETHLKCWDRWQQSEVGTDCSRCCMGYSQLSFREPSVNGAK